MKRAAEGDAPYSQRFHQGFLRRKVILPLAGKQVDDIGTVPADNHRDETEGRKKWWLPSETFGIEAAIIVPMTWAVSNPGCTGC